MIKWNDDTGGVVNGTGDILREFEALVLLLEKRPGNVEEIGRISHATHVIKSMLREKQEEHLADVMHHISTLQSAACPGRRAKGPRTCRCT